MERETESKPKMMLIPIAVIIFSAALRLIGLGSASLTMNEAENAMTALHLFENGSGGQLLYSLPTAILFKTIGSSEFTARLLPALMGIILSLLPFFIHKELGFRKACLLSFLLAADPVLLFWSKRADATIPAIAIMAAAAVLYIRGKKTASLTCFLISLSGGQRTWPVIAVMAVCFAVSSLCFHTKYIEIRFSKRNILIAGVLFVLFCTAFGFFPGGFNGLGEGFANSIRLGASWVYPGLTAVIMACALYCGIPLLVCIYNSFKSGKIPALLLSLAAAVGLLLWHGIIMLPWISVFLWFAASDTLLRLLDRMKGKLDFPFAMTAFIIPGAYAFFYFRLVELFKQANGNEPVQITWNGSVQTLPLTRFGGTVLLTIISVLILVLIIKILLGFVESEPIRRGMICGCLIVLSWGLITGIWNSGGFDREGDHPADYHLKNTANVLNGSYTSYSKTALFDLLSETIAKHGDKGNVNFGLNFVVNDPMVEWNLRNLPGIKTTSNIYSDLTGVDLILDRSGTSYDSMGYVRSERSWRGTMDWTRFSFRDWGNWLIFGDSRMTEDTPVSLWVRTDYLYSFSNNE